MGAVGAVDGSICAGKILVTDSVFNMVREYMVLDDDQKDEAREFTKKRKRGKRPGGGEVDAHVTYLSPHVI